MPGSLTKVTTCSSPSLFIRLTPRGRINVGDSDSAVAKILPLDLPTVAHHLALLNLPPMLNAATKIEHCSSPPAPYELSRLHSEQPQRVAELVASTDRTAGHSRAA